MNPRIIDLDPQDPCRTTPDNRPGTDFQRGLVQIPKETLWKKHRVPPPPSILRDQDSTGDAPVDGCQPLQSLRTDEWMIHGLNQDA